MIGVDTVIAELVLQIARLTTEISQLRAEVAKSPNFVEGWASPKDAAAALRNEGVKNCRHLKRLRLADAFSEGRDIRNVSKGAIAPRWEYHVPSCRKALQRHFKQLAG
jgi:hypothetical protein